MDKEWMSKNRLSTEFKIVVESFLQFAVKNAFDPKKIPCPCVECGNLSKRKVEIVRLHLLSRGIDNTYHTWIWHGEKLDLEDLMNASARGGEYGDVFVTREPIVMVHTAYEYTENPNEFNKLLEDAEKPLYHGCDKFTKLSVIVKLYNLKAKYGWGDKSVDDLLSLLGDMLPANNELPSSPWKVGKNSNIIEGIPVKVLWYFPSIPRFRRMFRNKEISRDLTWHIDQKVCDGYLRHPADAPLVVYEAKIYDADYDNFIVLWLTTRTTI